jgi:hypothetical protein
MANESRRLARDKGRAHLCDDGALGGGAASSAPSQLPTLSRAGQHGAASPPKPVGDEHPATGVDGGGGEAFSLPLASAESTDRSRPRGVCFLVGDGHGRLSSSPLRSLPSRA